MSSNPGAPMASDSRGLLKRLHGEFTSRTGLELRTGCEPEMTWQGPDLKAVFRPESSPAYHIDHLERNRDIVTKVMTYGKALGLTMIEGDYEDEFQVELNFLFDKAELTSDRLVVYRQICKQVARELGIGPESLRQWVNRAEIDSGKRPGTSTADAERIAKLERMLGPFTSDPQLRLTLALALKVLEMRGLSQNRRSSTLN